MGDTNFSFGTGRLPGISLKVSGRWLALPLLLFTIFCTRASAQATISLTELQQLAADNALDVLVAEQDLRSARYDEVAFNASLRPRLDLNANFPNYFRTSTEVTQDDGTVAFREIELNNSFVGLQASQQIAATGGTFGLSSRLQRTDNFSQETKSYNGSPIRLFFRQPIFAFNPLKWDRELLPLTTLVNERQLEATRAAAALEATERFFDLVTADQERRIAVVNKAANEQLYTVAEERYELGKINRGDLVQLRLELASAEQNLLRAERLVKAASAAIQQLIGQDYQGDAFLPELPEERIGADAGAEIDGQVAKQRMLARRPELLAARQRTRLAERDLDQTRRDLGPRVDIEAGFGFIRNDQELPPIYTDPREERVLSINLSLPILDWGQRKALKNQAETNRDLAVVIGQRAEQSLNAELEQLLEQWRTVQEELRLATDIRDLAEERFQISQESYTLGAIPLTELTLAQQFRDANVRAYAQTLRAYWLTYARLARLTLWDYINDKPLGS